MKRILVITLAIVSLAVMVLTSGCGKEKVYIVTFDANAGTGIMKSQTFVKNVSQALVSNKFSRKGYSFSEWNTIPDGTGVVYADAQEISLN
ncbi:MAG: InlB B-repeat-containing protein, partial [Bacteroidales bacterium]|nr:InlB B-repeat-containing protein [Bacteroidales bacterium]